jgi:hypothetical protein
MNDHTRLKYKITNNHIIFFWDFNEKLDNYLDLFRQNNIKSIQFYSIYSQSIDILPDYIESIKIDSHKYLQPIKKLPKDLKLFEIRNNYADIFADIFAINKFPEYLSSLSITVARKSVEFQTRLIDLINTCSNLKKLKIVGDETWQVGFGNLPSTLEELDILNLSNYKDLLSNLPINLKIFRCGIMCIEGNKNILQMLPHGIEKILIGKKGYSQLF